jgi:hypothetical protein
MTKKYQLKIRKPNKAFDCYTDLTCKELIDKIKTEFKKVYDIDIKKLSRDSIYNYEHRPSKVNGLITDMCIIKTL